MPQQSPPRSSLVERELRPAQNHKTLEVAIKRALIFLNARWAKRTLDSPRPPRLRDGGASSISTLRRGRRMSTEQAAGPPPSARLGGHPLVENSKLEPQGVWKLISEWVVTRGALSNGGGMTSSGGRPHRRRVARASVQGAAEPTRASATSADPCSRRHALSQLRSYSRSRDRPHPPGRARWDGPPRQPAGALPKVQPVEGRCRDRKWRDSWRAATGNGLTKR